MLTRNLLVQAIVQGLFPHSKYLPRLIDALFYVSPHILHAREQPGFTPFASVSALCLLLCHSDAKGVRSRFATDFWISSEATEALVSVAPTGCHTNPGVSVGVQVD